jgi:hypothetical protein
MTKNNHFKKATTMKTTIYTMIVLFVLTSNILTAGGIKHYTIKSETINVSATIDVGKLAPVAPYAAEFNDGPEFLASPDALVSKLAPATPQEADFEDPGLLIQITPEKLCPLTPRESDFEETDTTAPETPCTLAPSAPAEADFSA